MLGPTLMLREMGMQPDDLQLETMDEIRELVQYPTTASKNYFTQLENLARFGMQNPVPIWRKTYDYLTDEELLLRIKKNPHEGDRRHLITFDFLAHYGYMSLEEVVLRFSALSAEDKTFIDNSPRLLEDNRYIERHPNRCKCAKTNDERCADKYYKKPCHK